MRKSSIAHISITFYYYVYWCITEESDACPGNFSVNFKEISYLYKEIAVVCQSMYYFWI